ncbi:MAG: hypothetical protein Tsb0014_24720 [Pleurocapsa sp.]
MAQPTPKSIMSQILVITSTKFKVIKKLIPIANLTQKVTSRLEIKNLNLNESLTNIKI